VLDLHPLCCGSADAPQAECHAADRSIVPPENGILLLSPAARAVLGSLVIRAQRAGRNLRQSTCKPSVNWIIIKIL